MACGNDTIRAMHPVELFGHDWLDWSSSPALRKNAGRDAHRSHKVRDFVEYVLRHCKK
jgi:hypothetical protein